MTPADEQFAPNESICIFGPREGYSPQIGIFVSQLSWMRRAVVSRLRDLSREDLDWLPDANANSIGALLLHLAATDVYYGLNTFQGLPWANYSQEVKQRWGPAMKLGDLGRNRITGHDLQFYLAVLQETREYSLSEFRKRDDDWFLAVDHTWAWGPTKNFCKWFHVCEHESHHIGQIDLIIKNLRGTILWPVGGGWIWGHRRHLAAAHHPHPRASIRFVRNRTRPSICRSRRLLY
jgi:uncharacterized damage-inducible protein DinB